MVQTKNQRVTLTSSSSQGGGFSDKAYDFRYANPDIPDPESSVRIHFLENPASGRLSVLLEPGPDSTHDEIKAAIPLLLRWRDRLLETQYIEPIGIEILCARHEHGESYGALTKWMNQQLTGAVQRLAESKEYPVPLEVDSVYSPMLLHATGLLRAVGRSKTQIEAILSRALERVAAADHPFDCGQPVSRDWMEYYIEKRLAQKKAGKRRRQAKRK